MNPLRDRNVTVALGRFYARERVDKSKFGQWSAGLLDRQE
jgi:hypothetical protein